MLHQVWFTFILIFVLVEQGLCDDDERFMAGMSAAIESCKNFDNDHFKTENMKLAPMDSGDDGSGLMCIEGTLEIGTVIDEGIMINIDIEKETGEGSEPMMSITMDVCECIRDDDAPWKSVFEAMGITSCPVETGTYGVDKLIVNLSFADPILTRDYVGDYGCKVELCDAQRNKISCHNLGMCIVQM